MAVSISKFVGAVRLLALLEVYRLKSFGAGLDGSLVSSSEFLILVVAINVRL
jgi:hypothetical protein